MLKILSSIPASLLILGLAATPALALDGLAPAGPCAEKERPVTGSVAKMFSPVNVASSGAAAAPSIPPSQGFQGADACDTSGGCGGLNDVPSPRVTPTTNPPGAGMPPPELGMDDGS